MEQIAVKKDGLTQANNLKNQYSANQGPWESLMEHTNTVLYIGQSFPGWNNCWLSHTVLSFQSLDLTSLLLCLQ